MTVATKKTSNEEKFDSIEFDLFAALEAIDRKDYNWFSGLTDEQRKRFVPYMMLQWSSTVKAKSELASYYVMSTEYHANKHMFNEYINDHPQLQWLMLCAGSPGLGKQFHQWLGGQSPRIAAYREPVKPKEASDWVDKNYGQYSEEQRKSIAAAYLQDQHTKVYLCQQYPHLKLQDIEVLHAILSDQEISQHREATGE